MKGILSKLFKLSNSQESNRTKTLEIDKSQTPEKFQYLADEIIDFLRDKLQMLDKLENEVFKRQQILESKRTSPNLTHPDERALWTEYKNRCEEIIRPISSEPYNGNSRTLSKPAKYEYLTYPNTKIFFIMKSANRAVVELHFEDGIQKKEQFVLKKDGNEWKIETKKYGFPDENTWWKDEI